MPDNTPQFIEPYRVRRAFDRAAASYDAAAVLQREVCQRLLERLQCVKLAPTRILDAGTRYRGSHPAIAEHVPQG